MAFLNFIKSWFWSLTDRCTFCGGELEPDEALDGFRCRECGRYFSEKGMGS